VRPRKTGSTDHFRRYGPQDALHQSPEDQAERLAAPPGAYLDAIVRRAPG